jgi:hypothetical protein
MDLIKPNFILRLRQNMTDAGQLLLKILALSGAISLLIKYAVPYLNLPATSALALAFVLIPPLLLGIALVWRQQQTPVQPVSDQPPTQKND